MPAQPNLWPEVRSSLARERGEGLAALLDSCQLVYDGNYILSAGEPTFSGLCRAYPFIESAIQAHTGSHARLELLKSVPMGTATSDMEINLGAASVTEAILQPESIAAIPAYMLRFVPYVGASAVLIASALRQAFYRTVRERGLDQHYPRDGDSASIKVTSLLNMLGNVISRATFFRIFKDGGLDWFVRRAEPTHHIRAGQVQRDATTYQYRGLLLTPGDAADLSRWLVNQGLAQDPAGTLRRAIALPRDEILQFPYRVPQPGEALDFRNGASVHEVVSQKLQLATPGPGLAGLCDQLSAHLIRPESFLAVPWYFFREVLPELGADLGGLYLMCKNCCYVDWAGGQDRDSFWVRGGLATLQAWVRSETLPQHIPSRKVSHRGRPRSAEIKSASQYTRSWRENKETLAASYLLRTDTRAGAQGTDWQLQIADVHLTAKDEALKQAIYAFLYAPPEQLPVAALQHFARSENLPILLSQDAVHFPARLCHFETLVQAGICHSETLTPQEICHFDTLVDGLNCYFESLVGLPICTFETIIKILKRLKNTVFFHNADSLTTTNTAASEILSLPETETEVVAYLAGENWDFERILQRLNPQLHLNLKKDHLEPAFLSWLIMASLTPSIRSPLSLAVRRTLESGIDAGGLAARLSAEPPIEVVEAIQGAIYRLEHGYLGQTVPRTEAGRCLAQMLAEINSLSQQAACLARLADALGMNAAEV